MEWYSVFLTIIPICKLLSYWLSPLILSMILGEGRKGSCISVMWPVLYYPAGTRRDQNSRPLPTTSIHSTAAASQRGILILFCANILCKLWKFASLQQCQYLHKNKTSWQIYESLGFRGVFFNPLFFLSLLHAMLFCQKKKKKMLHGTST